MTRTGNLLIPYDVWNDRVHMVLENISPFLLSYGCEMTVHINHMRAQVSYISLAVIIGRKS